MTAQEQVKQQEAERAAKVIKRAIWLMENAQARGWSHALEQARKQVK